MWLSYEENFIYWEEKGEKKKGYYFEYEMEGKPLVERQLLTLSFVSQTRCPTPEETPALIDVDERSACHTPRCN